MASARIGTLRIVANLCDDSRLIYDFQREVVLYEQPKLDQWEAEFICNQFFKANPAFNRLRLKGDVHAEWVRGKKWVLIRHPKDRLANA